MKLKNILVIIAAILTMTVGSGYGQGPSIPLSKIHWEIIRLPVDTSLPVKFIAYDSLHAVMFTRKDSVYIDSLNFLASKYPSHYFETSDGGKTWEEIFDTTLGWFGGGTLYGMGAWVYPLLVDRSTRYWCLQHSMSDNGIGLFKSQNISNSFNRVFTRNSGSFQLATALTPTNPIIYSGDSGCLYRSTDGGVTFPYRIGGDKFRRIMHPSLSNDPALFGVIGPYIKKDLFHHTFIVNRPLAVKDSSDPLLKLFPHGMTVMITSDGGASWSDHHSLLPKENLENPLGNAHLQYINTKERLFLSSGYYYCEGYSKSVLYDKPIDYGGQETSHGYNFAYSDNDGRSWTFDSSFLYRRRGFEPSDKNTVWMSLTKNDMSNKYEPYQSAYILTRTTNMGATWEYDTTTLGHLYEQKADGHQIVFSDPRHGWIVARILGSIFILRYDANEQPLSVESDEGPRYFYPMWLHPIPAKDEVEVHFLNKGTIENIELYDILGR
ncbi:MAG TPA: sialidase family protein, partial [Candidatus Kapabacteria bacterium]